MIKKCIYENDICFFIEHWLNTQEKYLFEEICNGDFHVVYHSDYDNTDGLKKGRPQGGLCWVINKKCALTAQVFFNQYVSNVCIEFENNKLDLFGVWLPYDNNSKERMCLYKSNISLIEAQLKLKKSTETILMGDFNADLSRGKRFDKLICRMCTKLQLRDLMDSEYTYKKGEYTANIDHIFVRSGSGMEVTGKVIKDNLDTSDHRPIQACIKCKPQEKFQKNFEKKTFHKFDWKNSEFIDRYKKNLIINLKKDEFGLTANNINFKEILDGKMANLTKCLIKCARQAEKELNVVYASNCRAKKRYFRPDPEQIEQINLITELKGMVNFDSNSKLKYKIAVKKFRKMQRHQMYLNQIKSAIDLEDLMLSDKNKFWKDLKKFRKKNNNSSGTSPIPISDFAKYYSNLFSHDDRCSNQEQLDISNNVSELFKELGNTAIEETTLTEVEVESTINKLKLGKSIGADFVSNEMLKYGSCKDLVRIMTEIYNIMLKFGYTPIDFNTSLVTPIPKKDNNQSTPTDFRPISVSTTFAIVFEKLILGKIDFDKLICNNQFGYKKSTSCKQAYFVVNEAISYYNSGGSTMHLASLDATKAFDKLWRDGLFFKLKDKINSCLWRVLVSYYNNFKIIVKVGLEKSEAYRTTEGVKQGGVLSPYLFNFFIDNMITSGLDLKIGAHIGRTNVSVVSYCDDILLLGCTTKQLESLLDSCQKYAKQWKMEFNPKKSVYMEIGKFKNNNTIKMAGIIIPEVNEFIYLGLPIGDKTAKNCFLEKKMGKVERAFYSLYGIGCKPHALNPFTILPSFCVPTYSCLVISGTPDICSVTGTTTATFNSTTGNYQLSTTEMDKYVPGIYRFKITAAVGS